MYPIKILKTVFCLLVIAGFMNFAYGQSVNGLHMPGILADAGGHKLHLNIQGYGSPTVIFENGSADFSFVWNLVQPMVAQFTRTVSYDRAGYASSEEGPMPRTSRQICFELHTALNNTGIKPPYIFVGQSYGGFLVRAFARYYPEEVAGMVLVEAIEEDQKIFMGGETPQRIRDLATGRKEPDVNYFFKATADTIHHPEQLNTEIDPLFHKFPDSIQQMQAWAQSQPQFIKAVQAEMDWSPEDVANLYQHKGEPAYTLGNIPLIVLTRGSGGYNGRKDSLQLENERLTAQQRLAGLSENSKHIIDKNSGHNIHIEDPAIVINAIKRVFIAVKNDQPL